jgi:hypothetical protein
MNTQRSASANCSQQHKIVVTAHAINLQESWRFHDFYQGLPQLARHHEEDPGDEVGQTQSQ